MYLYFSQFNICSQFDFEHGTPESAKLKKPLSHYYLTIIPVFASSLNLSATFPGRHLNALEFFKNGSC